MKITIERKFDYYRNKWLYVVVCRDDYGNITSVSVGCETLRKARIERDCLMQEWRMI